MLRASLDHHNPAIHEAECGARSWQPALDGLRWLSQSGFSIAVAVSLPNPITPPALAMPRSSRPKASRSTRTTRRAWSCFRRSTRLPTCRRDRRRAGNHDRMLGHPRQFARRHHVRDQPDGGPPPRRKSRARRRLHADPLRCRLRPGQRPCQGSQSGRAQPSPLSSILRARSRQLFR